MVAAGVAFIGGAVTLFGWLTGLPRLTDWDGDGIAMLANTSLAMAVAGAGALLLLHEAIRLRRAGRIAIVALGSIAAVIGGLTLVQHITGLNVGVDTFLVRPAWGERAAASPGRMGPPASTTFLILGTVLILGTFRRGQAARRAAAILALVATIPPLVAWTAYFYGADPLFSLPKYTGIARQTSALLLLLTGAMVVAIDEFGIGALLKRRDAAGAMVRRLLPLVIAVLFLTGWLGYRGFDAGLYAKEFGDAVLTVVRIVMFVALLWWTAHAIGAQIERRRSVEAALTESQERFRVMVDAIPQLAWMARPDGWIYWYNRRWYEYTGTTPEQMEGWGWQSVHDPASLPGVMERWKASIATGQPFDMVFPLRGADGVFRPFLTRVEAVRNSRGEVLHWFGTNTDISEQQSAQDALRQTNRIKDEFLATLSHELRTPMSAILGWSQMLRAGSGGKAATVADLEHGLEVIERNARLQSQIIEDLLEMSRILSGKVRLDVQSINLDDVVRAAVDAIRPSAEVKGIRLQLVSDPNIREVRGDPNRLQQVFYNLLTNAVKFTPKGGRIQVAVQRVNSHVEVSVSDSGIGIKPEFLHLVFERFRQQDASTTRSFGGLGLGLSISKQLVELHGGSIHAASAGEGLGATFTVQLPVAAAVLSPTDDGAEAGIRVHPAAAMWERPQAAAQADEQHLRGLTVLVVDDERDARELLKRMLESRGAAVTTAASGADALEYLKAHRPSMLVCDIGMPGMDGYELIRTIRALPPEQGGKLPAIALTAFARSEDRTRSIRSGFQMHLSKPVETAELLASIDRLSERPGIV